MCFCVQSCKVSDETLARWCVLSTGRENPLISILFLILVSVITVAQWRQFLTYRESHPPNVVMQSPLFFSLFLPPSRLGFAPGRSRRDVSCERTNEIPSASGQEGSRAENMAGRSLSCLFGGRVEKKKGGGGGARWGVGRKRGKREEK